MYDVEDKRFGEVCCEEDGGLMMTLDEWISRYDNEEADKLTQDEQIEIKSMLIELRWRRLLESELTMAKNKMSQVAAMFGKTLGEEFDVRFNGKLKCLKFDERGLLYFDGNEWPKNYAYLDWLVRGKAVIVDE